MPMASSPVIPASVVLKTIRSMDSITSDDLRLYSLMKHGEPQAIKYFAKLMADKIYSQVFASGTIDTDQEIMITSSAYGAVPTASYALMKEIASLLIIKGVKLTEIKIHRQGDFSTTHYGSMAMLERRDRMKSRQIYLTDEVKQLVAGKVVIVIDDINVTGSHEESIRDLFKTTLIKRHIFCYLYGFSKFMASSEPQLEDVFNHEVIKSVHDLTPFFTKEFSDNKSLIINARVLKFILNTDDTDQSTKLDKIIALKIFLNNLADEVLSQLYQAATSVDGYYKYVKFIDGFYILSDIVVSRRLVPIDDDHRIKGNTVYKFISIDNDGNLVDMVNYEFVNELGKSYSLMKFGSVNDINWFGQKTAEAFIARLNDPTDNLLKDLQKIGNNQQHLALVSPGSRNVESAQNFVIEVAVKHINIYLALHSLPTIILIKLPRFASGSSNYAELDATERFRHKRNQSVSKSILPGEDFFGLGVHAIFADDVRITGASADRLENTFLLRGALSFASMYCIVVDPQNVLENPSIEHFINQFLIKGNLDSNVAYILNQEGFRPVQRMMRLILSENNRHELAYYLTTYIHNNNALIQIYQSSLGNNFHQDNRYASSIPILCQVLQSRGLVDANGLLL